MSDFLVYVRRTYPLILCSGLATALVAARVWVSGSAMFIFLIWNLLLAWVPYLCSLWAERLQLRAGQGWWLLPAAIWLAFLPNAPYLVTDFVHLRPRASVPLWYDATLLMTFAWSGCYLAVASLQSMQRLVARMAGRLLSWLFVAASALLCGLGVYMGRFLRWNSWDILSHPTTLVSYTVERVQNPSLQAIGFTGLFAAFFLFLYITLYTFGHLLLERPQKN